MKVEDESWGSGGIEHSFSFACRVILTIPADMELKSLHLSTDMGDISADASFTAGEAELSTDLGDVVCRGLRARELEAESDLGDVTVEVPADCKDLSYTLSTDLGEVSFNGEPQRNPTVVIRSNEKYSVEAKSSLGNVSLEYLG